MDDFKRTLPETDQNGPKPFLLTANMAYKTRGFAFLKVRGACIRQETQLCLSHRCTDASRKLNPMLYVPPAISVENKRSNKR